MTPKLELKRVSYSYHSMEGETPALSAISFTADAGSYIAIVGPSGCGKSTLLSLLSGLARPDEGEIFLDGKPLEQAKDTIGYMLQKDHLFEWRSILSNVSLGLEIRKQMDPENLLYLKEMLKTYGLEDFQDKRPSQLSGGMRQRAALIRTLALKPDLLLLDEPFSALDYQTRLSVCDDISSIIRKTKKTAILVTHDLSEAISVADRIVILSARPARVKRILDLSFSSPSESGYAQGSGRKGAGSTSTYGSSDIAGCGSAGTTEQEGTGTISHERTSTIAHEKTNTIAHEGSGTTGQGETGITRYDDKGTATAAGASAAMYTMSPMERRNAPEFSYYFNLLWKELRTDDTDPRSTD